MQSSVHNKFYNDIDYMSNNYRKRLHMKEKVTAFYESKYFIPAMALVLFIIVTAVIYFVLEELKLWFALFILLCFIIFIKVTTFFLKVFFSI